MVPTADATSPMQATAGPSDPPPVGPRVDLPPPPPSGPPLEPAAVWTWTAPAGHDRGDGPPPPPEDAVRRDGPARRTAATIVAATGALLLLAAAATFLAVSWDQLGLTARVAAVGSGTAAAIVGGARLRRTLPAVGAVVFHLGALLVPVDALGLALQLDASRAATWITVGLVTVLTLPVAAAVGRSRVLAAAALIGVPVLATGLGLAGVAAAPVVTSVAALLAIVAIPVTRDRDDALSALAPFAAPALAVTAVAGSLALTATSALAVQARGVPLVTAAAAGWVPTTWSTPAIAGVLAVVALAVSAVLRRSAVLAGGVPILVVLAAATLLLPGDAPRLAELLPWPLLFLALEAAAASVRADRPERAPLEVTARVAEVLAALALPGALWTVASATRDLSELFGSGAASRLGPDPVLATVATLTATAWAVAAARRAEGATRDAATAGAVIALAAGLTWWAPTSLAGAGLLLAGVVAATTVRVGGARGAVASAGAITLGGTAIAGAWSAVSTSARWTDEAVALLVAGVAGAVAIALIVRTERHATVGEHVASGVLVPCVLLVVWIAGLNVHEAGGDGPALLAAGVLLAGGAMLLRRHLVAGDVLRLLAALLVVTVPRGSFTLEGAAVAAPAATAVAVLLLVAFVRDGRRPALLVLVGPVVVRAAAGVTFAATGSRPGTGAVLLAVAVAAALAAVLRHELRLSGAVTALAAGVPAIALLAVTPTALAWATVGVGLAIVAGGLATARIPVAHLGGVVATLGVWQLLSLADVDAIDAWLAAPALQLWLAALPARRAGRLSSWTADVPPLVLVVVPALLERIAGGGGWHAAAAGALGLAAVIGGGVGRHAGPLVVGVVTLVVVVGVETLAVVAAVPTWAWLTVGGVVLLGAGAIIERTGGAPVAGAKRLADVLTERFD